MPCGKCLRWPLERRCRSASARREAAAHCCEQSRHHKITWSIGEKQNTWKGLTFYQMASLYCILHFTITVRQMNRTQTNLIQEMDFVYITTVVRNWCLKFLVDLHFSFQNLSLHLECFPTCFILYLSCNEAVIDAHICMQYCSSRAWASSILLSLYKVFMSKVLSKHSRLSC